MLSMPSSYIVAQQFKERLEEVYDSSKNEVKDIDELARIMVELLTAKLTATDLEQTRLGRLVNEIRKLVHDKALTKTIRSVLKIWRVIAKLDNGQQPSAGSLVSPSSQSNDTSSRSAFNGRGGTYVPTSIEKENAANQHPALLRIRNQHTPLTSPSKDHSGLNHHRLVSPSSLSNLSPTKKLNNLYSRSATASPRDSHAQQQANGMYENGHSKRQLGKGVSPAMRNTFSNILGGGGVTVSPSNSTNMHASSNASSRNCSPMAAYPFNHHSDGSNSNFSNTKLSSRHQVHDEDSVGSNSNFSNQLSRFGNGTDCPDGSRHLDSSKKSKKRKLEPDTLRENLNSILNSTGGRKAQSTKEILQNCMKNNPLSNQSSPALMNGLVTKKARMANGNIAYLDENAVDDFDSVRRNGYSSTSNLPVPEPSSTHRFDTSYDSDDSDYSPVPYDFDRCDHTVDDELASLYAKLPKLTREDLAVAQNVQFEEVDEEEVVQLQQEEEKELAALEAAKTPEPEVVPSANGEEYEKFEYLEEYEEEEEVEVEVTDDECSQFDEADDVSERQLQDESMNSLHCDDNLACDNDKQEPEIAYSFLLSPVADDLPEDLFPPSDSLFVNSVYDEFVNESPFLSSIVPNDAPKEDKKKDENKNEDKEDKNLDDKESLSPVSEEFKLDDRSEKSNSVSSPAVLQDDDDEDEEEEEEEDDEEEAAEENGGFIEPNTKLIDEMILPKKPKKKIVKKVLKKKFRPKIGLSRIKKDVLNKFAKEEWPGMNGNYDDEGKWCSNGDVSYCKAPFPDETFDDEMENNFNTDFLILPYTNCTW